MPRLQSRLRRIQSNTVYTRRGNKKVNRFFHQREREPQFIRGKQIGLVYMEKEIKRFLL